MTTDNDPDVAPGPTRDRSTGALIPRRTAIALITIVGNGVMNSPTSSTPTAEPALPS